MSHEIGSRIGAMSHADATTVYLYGYGTYVGDEVPQTAAGMFAEIARENGARNPKLVLDDGSVVWGCECWWGTEESVKSRIGGREVVFVSIDEARARSRARDAEAVEPTTRGGVPS